MLIKIDSNRIKSAFPTSISTLTYFYIFFNVYIQINWNKHLNQIHMHNVNNYLFDQQGNQSVAFDKYLGDSHEHVESYSHDLKRDLLLPQIQSINMALKNVCQQRMGNILTAQTKEIQKTIQLVNTLISMRRKDIEARTQFHNANRKHDVQKQQMVNQIQRLSKQKRSLQNQKQSLTLKIKNMEKIFKETIEKLNLQKEEAVKQSQKIQNRENHFQSQFRKKDGIIKQLKDNLKKYQQKHAYRNGFEVMQQIHQQGPNLFHVNAQHQYNNMVSSNIDQTYASIVAENQYYKDCLTSIYKELHSVLELKKEALRRRRGFDSQLQNNSFQLNVFRPETMSMPGQHSRQGFDLLNYNITKFKEAMKYGQGDQKNEDQKVTCVNNVKNLLRNYKSVIQSQDQLLNKVILKAKQFKNNDIAYLENRYSKNIDEEQMERARKFLDDQNKYLDTKNKELESMRRAMHNTIKRAQEDRNQTLKRKAEYGEEVTRIRKNIELLPAMIEQELNRE